MHRKVIARTSAALIVGLLSGAAAMAGTITGTVNYDGRVPNLRPLKMDADPGCLKKHSGPVKPELLVLGPGNTLGNVFVQIKSGVPEKDYPPPSEPVVIDQDGCIYKPHVLGIMVGQTLKILNSDGLLHNVHSLSKVNSPFNRAMPGSVTEAEFTFSKDEEMFKVKCDVHPWMGAFISVMEHPFFDTTAKDGKYEIGNLPAGTYEIEVRHEFERFPPQTSTVTISADETKTVDFTFKGPSS